jgi:hypothetical protein
LPLWLWGALALLPVGFGLRRFKKDLSGLNEEEPVEYIWEKRQYKKS